MHGFRGNGIVPMKPGQEIPQVSSRACLQRRPFHILYLFGYLLTGLAFVLPVGKPAVSTFHLHAARRLRWRGLRPKLVYHVAAKVLVVPRRDIQSPIGVLSRGNNGDVGAALPLMLSSLLGRKFAFGIPAQSPIAPHLKQLDFALSAFIFSLHPFKVRCERTTLPLPLPFPWPLPFRPFALPSPAFAASWSWIACPLSASSGSEAIQG